MNQGRREFNFGLAAGLVIIELGQKSLAQMTDRVPNKSPSPSHDCPLLITEPANEAYCSGQSQELYDLVTSPKKLIHFSESDGAELHCEPKGTGLRDLRVFNWLDETLK